MRTINFERMKERAGGSSGFSLIEMMISITIGMVIVIGLVGVLVSNSRSSKTNDRSAEVQTNGRYALDHFRREFRHAGYRGYTWAEPSTPTGAINVNNECGGNGSGFIQNIHQGIWGANDVNPYATNCLNGLYLRGDVVVIRRLGNQLVNTTAPATTCPGAWTAAQASATGLYFRSTYAAGMLFQGLTPPATLTVTQPCADFGVIEYVYYIGSDDANATVPALRRVALTGGAMVDEMIVSGIEHMQLQYGVATTDGNTRYYDANVMTGLSTDSAKSDWDDVNSIRIWLLARSAKADNGYSNTQTYVMGDQSYTVNDSFPRQLYTTVLQLRN